jgi:hypothetical protein
MLGTDTQSCQRTSTEEPPETANRIFQSGNRRFLMGPIDFIAFYLMNRCEAPHRKCE